MLFQLSHPIGVLGIAVALIVGVLLHDAAQVLVAQALGDSSARRAGWLRSRGSERIEVFGAICGLIVGYGWAAPVPMEDRYRHRRTRVAVALAAGPITYLGLCFACTALLSSAGAGQLQRAVLLASYTLAAMFIVSLIPVPPLDGGRILLVLAPTTLGWQKARYQLVERNIGLAVALAVVMLPLLIRIPSVVGNLSADVLNPVGRVVAPDLSAAARAVGEAGLGDEVQDGYDVP